MTSREKAEHLPTSAPAATGAGSIEQNGNAMAVAAAAGGEVTKSVKDGKPTTAQEDQKDEKKPQASLGNYFVRLCLRECAILCLFD